jgi:hypothetical protein
MKQYPVILRKQTGHIFRKTCQWCGERTPYAVEIQWTYMRGDDDVIKLCENCQKRLSDSELIKIVSIPKKETELPHKGKG